MTSKQDLEKQVIMGVRDLGISMVLFRHVVGNRLGVNVTDMECLGLLALKGIATPKELSAYTGLSSGATTAMLDRLERNHLIKRSPNPGDRRGIHISIDKQTAEQNASMFTSTRQVQNELVASYSEAELKILSDFFVRSIAMWDDGRKELLTSN
jgi:DNA-binding MarR family transcriptional regulator